MYDYNALGVEACEYYGTFSIMFVSESRLDTLAVQLDLDDLTIDNAYFRSFDMVVRRILDPVWHKVGPRTKQLVSDLATLRRLLTYVVSSSL